ncbi:acyltransferase [Castellaniella sp.]|uniref:acyltransferase family protein n=1 Tax=Castellaniella sp. TaxID=1955812 RepID=UPI002B003414|nr:acyltransferase [Castellaniella sp.]
MYLFRQTSTAQPPGVVSLQQRLGGLQCLRAIAAFGVVLQHAIYYACQALGLDYMQYLKIGFGGIGVNLFFTISGFVMAGCLSQGNRFFWNRIQRIYPGYWLTIAVSALLLINPVYQWSFSWTSFFLMPTDLNHSYHIPYWTLAYELGFYFLVASVIALRCSVQTITRLCVIWLLMIVLVSRYTSVSVVAPGLWLWLSPYNIFFIAGFLLGLHYHYVRNLPSLPLALAAIVLCALGEILYVTSSAGALMLYALGLAAVLLLGVRHLNIPWLERIGDASYGIYLVHAPVIVLFIALVQDQLTGFYPLMLASLVFSMVVSIIYGLGEFKLYTMIKKNIRALTVRRTRG